MGQEKGGAAVNVVDNFGKSQRANPVSSQISLVSSVALVLFCFVSGGVLIFRGANLGGILLILGLGVLAAANVVLMVLGRRKQR